MMCLTFRRATLLAVLAMTLLSGVVAPATYAAGPPATWDHLVRVKAKQFDQVYLLPGADFRGYSKILIEPVQVAFRKNWMRDMNDTRDLSRRITDDDAARIVERTRGGAMKLFADAFRAAGYEIVTEPGPGVLRVAPNIIDLYITAPDTMSAGRTRTYAVDAGEATLALEARDSVSGEILGRAVDRERAGGLGGTRLSRATDVSNTRISSACTAVGPRSASRAWKSSRRARRCRTRTSPRMRRRRMQSPADGRPGQRVGVTETR